MSIGQVWPTLSSVDSDRLAYTPEELARALGCTRQHIYNLIGRGELASVKLGGKRLIPRSVVEKVLLIESEQ